MVSSGILKLWQIHWICNVLPGDEKCRIFVFPLKKHYVLILRSFSPVFGYTSI